MTAEDLDQRRPHHGLHHHGRQRPRQARDQQRRRADFKDDPDFETPTDAGTNNGYVVEVTVTGGSAGRALTAERTITVNVTDENERPHFTSVDTFAVAENVLLAVRLAAQDVDRDDRITGYAVTGGADSDDFEIKNTRELHFKDDLTRAAGGTRGATTNTPVKVEVTGGSDARALTAAQTITVTVEDDVEPPASPTRPPSATRPRAA